jgi:hypothetical protein
MAKTNEMSLTTLRDEELSAVSGAKWCPPKKYGSYTDNSKHASVDISNVFNGNTITLTEKGPGDLSFEVNIGNVSQ